MNDLARGGGSVSGGDVGNTLHKKELWSEENLKYSHPHYRLEKSARIINRLVGSRSCKLLDVGCGPATLMSLLSPNIQYYGIDIAIHDPAPNLIEADLIEMPIRFGDERFDIIIAQGVFEYMGSHQAQKFTEIAGLLNDRGLFIVSYVNFSHRGRNIYWLYSNVQTLDDFRRSLAREFKIHRFFPTSYNWNPSEPNRKLLKAANMNLNIKIPFISRVLAVEYFFICSKNLIGDVRGADASGFRRYAGCMRYAQGGGLTAEGRRRREQVQLEAARRFELRVPTAVIAAELRVSEPSVRRRAGLAGRGHGRAGLSRASGPVSAG